MKCRILRWTEEAKGIIPFALDGDFKEGEHPRDSDGKFTSNGETGNNTEWGDTEEKIKNNIIRDVEKLLKLSYNDQEVTQAFTESGKNYGFYKHYRENKKSSIQNSIKSLQKRINEHISKIQNPKEYCKKEKWDNFSRERKINLMKHWLDEIRISKIQIEICNYLLANKKES